MAIEFMSKPYTKTYITRILNSTFKKWFLNKFKEFTVPQQYAIPTIHQRENILVSSPTGSGKTLSAFGAILNELIDLEEKGKLEDKIYCVYISPLKALSNDIRRNLLEPKREIEEILGRELKLRIATRTGDTTQTEKAKMARSPPHILITTPESLAIMVASPKFREKFKDVQWGIVDEIHSLAENKRGVHLSLSLERLQHLSPGMARVGLSATVSPLEEIGKFLVGKRDCKIVDVQFIKEYDFQVLSPVDDLVTVSQGELHEKMYSMIHDLVQKHKTTLIFTNTRAATERVVHNLKHKFPKKYTEKIGEAETYSRIGAHHGSLSKKHRLDLEQDLKDGKLKCVVCSTSLELGIDIGFIDLVICLGSPKSVARLLQRAGRAGHSIHKKTKARIIVMDRDDLLECSVMLKSSLEKKIDRIHIPTNCLDVLAQHILGMAIEEVWDVNELYEVLKKSYCYHNLDYNDYISIVSYLAGEYASLESRYIYAKIWHKEGKIGRRGKMTRVIYMTNIGTIPDETAIQVKEGDVFHGTIDESFLERLKPGDVFVLGGNIYQFRYSRGTTAQVKSSVSKPPTVPSWFSEQLPLSFDLANDIGRFRSLMEEYFEAKATQADIISFIHNHLSVDKKAAKAVYKYLKEQYDFCGILPTNKKILVEHYEHDGDRKIVFHTLYGRRVNDCLSRALAYSISLTQKRDVEIGINDNGFYIGFSKPVKAVEVFKQLNADNLPKVMNHAIEKSEVLKRRFRHCATRSLMILRTYMGREKRVGKQQQASMILMKALRELDENFTILKEAKREVLEDSMDFANAIHIIDKVNKGDIEITEIHTKIPSPFAFNLILQGHLDILKMEDKIEFLKRMHSMVLAKIDLSKGGRKLTEDTEKVSREFGNVEKKAFDAFKEEKEVLHPMQERLLDKARRLRRIPVSGRKELLAIIKGKKIIDVDPFFLEKLQEFKQEVMDNWPKELADFVFAYINGREKFDLYAYFDEMENNPKHQKALLKEDLIENIKLVARRQKIDDDIKFELIDAVSKKIKLSKETKKWLKEFLKKAIPKYCKDNTYYFLKKL